MDDQPEPDSPVDNRLLEEHSYGLFLPFVVLAATLVAVLGWEFTTQSQSYSDNQRLQLRQAGLVEQSRQAQASLEKLARDLIDLATIDDDARALVAKYQIAISNPPSVNPTSSPSTTR